MLALGLALDAAPAQVPNSPPACRDEVIVGRVNAGQEYEVMLTSTLAFRLDAETQMQNPQGWTIRVVPRSEGDADYSMVATPPYRFANPRYVDTSYGVTAEQALAMTPLEFAFVASPADYDAAMAALDILLWPTTHTPEQVEAARYALSELPTYPGRLWIEDGSVGSPDPTNPLGIIEWISFRVDICLPTG